MEPIAPKPLVSFIITAYDLPAEMLCTCVDSILKLSLNRDEREIIVVDDGSKRPAIDDLQGCWDELTYLRQANQGLSAARNHGLQCATGAYVQFVDGDDYLLPAPYEHCLDIARYQNPDVVMFLETEKAHPETPFLYDGPVSGAAYMHQNNLRSSACGYLFRRAILGSLRFTPGLLHEDEEFTPLLLLRAERVFSTPAEAYFYRRHEASIMSRTDHRHIARRLSDITDIILHLQDVAQHAPEIDRVALNRRIAQLSMDYLYNTIRLTHSRHQLAEAIGKLRRHGLFPLPDKAYTRKYTLFRRLVGTRMGRQLLLLTIR